MARSKRTSSRAIVVLVALVLVVVLALAASIGSQGFTNKNVKTWFNGWGTSNSEDKNKTPVDAIEVDENTVAVDGDGNQLVQDKVYAMPRNIMFMSSRAATTSSVTVSATITPDNADDKRVTWSSSDSSSVSVTPNEDDSLTATITCLNKLSDGPVYITCTSVDNPQAKAVCQIDYLASGNDLDFYGYLVGEPDELVMGNTYEYMGYFSATPGSGTVFGQANGVGCTIDFDSDFMDTVDSYLAESGYSAEDDKFSCNYDAYSTSTGNIKPHASPFNYYCGNCTSAEVFNHAFKMAMRDCDTHAKITISANYVYNGKSYGRYNYQFNLKFSMSGIWIGVDDVGLDDENIVFGT